MYSVQPIRRVRKKRMSEINVVPYIDVMLVLLVIFMITTPLLSQGISVELPQTSSKPIAQMDEEPIIVSVDRGGRYYLNLGDNNDRPLQSGQLMIRIKAVLKHRQDNMVYVKGDKNANYGKVVALMAELKQAGVEQVGLVTRMPEKSSVH
ncbi:Tol biopolymer transport system, TolR protein [hydrothermal vent metagenome]|uniref:Tol biopolymer transport system, TolR protein n=1 Tax=hydrothermal vent metagenome TaxID=652676 RepID=A0A3B1BNV2_9ZZZZ